MSKPKAIWLSAIGFAFVLIAFGGYKILTHHGIPLGDSPELEFPKSTKSTEEIQDFFSGNVALIHRVESFPEPIRWLYRENGGSRFTMANPGHKFNPTDFINDSSVPSKKLIVAGVSEDKCFVQGGIGLSSQLVFFKLASNGNAEAVWRGYCGDFEDQSAKTVEDLRTLISRGGCRDGNSITR